MKGVIKLKFFNKLSVSKEGQLLTICSGPFTSDNLHHIVII